MKGSLQECVDAILTPLLSTYGHASILSLWWLDASCMLILPYINLALNWFWWNIKQINVKSPLNAAPIAYFANEMWGLCTAASQNPISCSCLSVYPWLRRSFTCDRSVSIICKSSRLFNEQKREKRQVSSCVTTFCRPCSRMNGSSLSYLHFPSNLK